MKSPKKGVNLAILIICSLVVVLVAQAKSSFSYYTKKAKADAESALKSAKSRFKKGSAGGDKGDSASHQLMHDTEILFKKGSAGGDRGDPASYQLMHDTETFDQLIEFLRKDSVYAGNLEEQSGFLNRFPGLTSEERLIILDIVNDPKAGY